MRENYGCFEIILGQLGKSWINQNKSTDYKFSEIWDVWYEVPWSDIAPKMAVTTGRTNEWDPVLCK